jgi:segregation and condensation protein B
MRVQRTLRNTEQSGRAIQKIWNRDLLQPTEILPVQNLSNEPALPIQRLEAVLLVSQEPIPPRKLVSLADLADATQVRTLTRELNQQYKLSGHAYSIEEVAGGYILLTRKQFAPWIKKNQLANPTEHLSQSALETLATVAYRQPVLRVDIEAIRGLSCDEVLRQLMEKDLVKICGRSEELGRPYLYGTTKRFLQLFGLHSLDKLPRVEWLRRVESTITNSPTEEHDSSSSTQQ